jgi:CMP-N-acetylneuraminic acid synthetase
MTPALIALVPMRHHSVRVPGKNLRPLGARPLYEHILETLQACPAIEGIVVDTDSPDIRDGVRRRFPDIELLDRPAELCGDEVPMNLILAHDVEMRSATFYLQTHSTNPLLRAETIAQAIAEFRAHYPENDSLFSVTRWHKRLWDTAGRPVNHDPQILLATQDLPPIFEENSCLYLFERETFRQAGNRLGRRPRTFEIEADEAWDIDNEKDFAIAEALLEARR